MSADTLTTAMFLITAVIAAGVLISAIFPVVYQMSGTFTAAGHASDQQIRTNMQIVLDVANTTDYVRVWIKNTGSVRIPTADIQRSDVFCGDAGNFNRMNLATTGTLGNGQWTYVLTNPRDSISWNPGDTLEIDVYTATLNQIDPVYFQFVLPSGISTSDQFTVSTTP